MTHRTKRLGFLSLLVLGILALAFAATPICRNSSIRQAIEHETGDILDSLNGVYVYYNGNVSNVSGRNLAPDGYNLGLKYQCVEFVKRYYYQHYHHKMPDSYGHALSYYDVEIEDGKLNPKRALIQYKNGGSFKPQVGDLIVFDGNSFNPYGHVAIISEVRENEIEMIQQNPGPTAPSRETIKLKTSEGKFRIGRSDCLGWLRKR